MHFPVKEISMILEKRIDKKEYIRVRLPNDRNTATSLDGLRVYGEVTGCAMTADSCVLRVMIRSGNAQLKEMAANKPIYISISKRQLTNSDMERLHFEPLKNNVYKNYVLHGFYSCS